MNVLLLTYGTRGDVQPFVALGVALQARGHAVTLATARRFERFAAAYGLAFAPISDAMLAVLDTPEGRELVENNRTILDSVRHNLRFARRIGPMLREQLDDSRAAARIAEPDLVVFHPKGFAGPLIAEQCGCPAVVALPFPMLVPTGERPHIGFPRLPLGPGYNRLTHRLVGALTARAMKGPLARSRAAGGLPRARRIGPLHAADGARLPSLTAVSPTVVPAPRDWGADDRMIGYWFLRTPADWRPPARLQAFLETGPPPVYVGFGSMVGKAPGALARIAIEALAGAGLRGILTTGWGGLAPGELPPGMLAIEAAPHAWLLPRTLAAVHHGGAGTTAAALQAGIPSVVVPFMGDQPFWAARIEALGAGPAAIPQKRLDASRLGAALRRVATDSALRGRAAELGERVRREDGAGAACRYLEALAGS